MPRHRPRSTLLVSGRRPTRYEGARAQAWMTDTSAGDASSSLCSHTAGPNSSVWGPSHRVGARASAGAYATRSVVEPWDVTSVQQPRELWLSALVEADDPPSSLA